MQDANKAQTCLQLLGALAVPVALFLTISLLYHTARAQQWLPLACELVACLISGLLNIMSWRSFYFASYAASTLLGLEGPSMDGEHYLLVPGFPCSQLLICCCLVAPPLG